MGGSKSSDVKETNITTSTSTTMRDVGLTGKDAVDMAAIIQAGGIESTRISASTLNNLMQKVGKTSQQLIGGASDLVHTQAESVRIQGEQAAGFYGTLAESVRGFSQDLIGGTESFVSAQKAVTTGEESDLVKLAPFAAVAVIAVMVLTMKRGRR